MSDFPMLPDSSVPNRLPAPSPCKSCIVSKAGWITAMVAAIVAAFFFFQFLSCRSDAKLQRNNAELAQVETQSLKQQLFAERILAERQIADLKTKTAAEPCTFVCLAPPPSSETTGSAVIVWQPTSGVGTFICEQLSPPAQDEEYCLWFETAGNEQIGIGPLAIGSGKGTAVKFSTPRPITAPINRLILTREHKGGATAPTGPVVLSGTP